jgi:hypothetical protein
MNNTEVLERVRDATADIQMEIPLEAIVARGRVRRLRRRRRVAATGSAATVALAAVVIGALHAQPRSGLPSPAKARLAAFTVSTTSSGSTALTLRKGEQYRLDPDALRQALAAHGVPALVTVGRTCDTNPEPTGLDRVVAASRNADGAVNLTINPEAMPSGAELSIGYYATGTAFGLIYAGGPLHCAAHPPGSQVGGIQPQPVGST